MALPPGGLATRSRCPNCGALLPGSGQHSCRLPPRDPERRCLDCRTPLKNTGRERSQRRCQRCANRRPVERRAPVRLVVMLTEEDRALLDGQAQAQGVTVTQLLRTWIREAARRGDAMGGREATAETCEFREDGALRKVVGGGGG